MLVTRKGISTALCALALGAAAPAFAANRNQATADAVATALRSSPSLSRCKIEIETREGMVTLAGTVPAPAAKAEAIARTMKVAGVTAVLDRLRVTTDPRVRQAQYLPAIQPPADAAGTAIPMNGPIPYEQPAQVAFGGVRGGMMYDGAPMGGMTGYNGMVAGSPIQAGPIPEGAAGMVGGTQAAVPGAGNYAWPNATLGGGGGGGAAAAAGTGYPTTYPWQAWTNVGPAAPHPEIPLDWRAVTLRWDDGLWWLDFKKNYSRPFFTPWPFGIWAY